MGIRRYRHLHLDVFTDQRVGENQLAVFPEAAGLSVDTMQRDCLCSRSHVVYRL